MNKPLFFLAVALISFQITAGASTDPASETGEIKKVIEKAYIDGLQNWGDTDVIRQYVVPEFVMLRLAGNEIQKLPIETWISNIEKQKAAYPGGPPYPATAKYLDIDVVGTAAMVKFELHRQGQRQFTDYVALYKFEDGWKIVGKTFYRH